MSAVSFLQLLMDDSDQGKKYPGDPVKIPEVSQKNPGNQLILQIQGGKRQYLSLTELERKSKHLLLLILSWDNDEG